MDIEKLKKAAGYDGKSQQWQYGFDLACRELAKASAVPDGYCIVPIAAILKILDATSDLTPVKTMIEAAQEQGQ